MVGLQLKIGGRLAAGFAAILGVLAVTVGVVSLKAASARATAAEVASLRAPASVASLKLANATVASANALRGYILTHDPAQRDQWRAQWRRIDQLANTMDGLSGQFTSAQNRAAWQQVRETLATFRSAQSAVLDSADTVDTATAATALRTTVVPKFNQLEVLLVGADGNTGLAGRQATMLTSDIASSNNQISEINALLLIVLGGLMVAASAIGWFTARGITVPLGQLNTSLRDMAGGRFDAEVPGAGRHDEIGDIARAAVVFRENGIERIRLEAEAANFRQELAHKLKEAETAFEAAGRDQKRVVDLMARDLANVARGDLSVRLSEAVAPEYQALKDDFNAAVSSLEEVIRTIAATTEGISSGSDEIAQASDDLSRRTEQQAASLEETAAALDEITSTVRRTAAGAQEASSVVVTARGDAEQSGKVVRQAVAAMGEIEKSSAQIGEIISVIDEIAFQTNLLALNAGVEAARAGDAGRGFAVVASEVRALAQRSADAAKEIKALISNSSSQVGSGVDLVGQAGAALHRIADQVVSIDALVQEMAASAQEQATGLAQVNTAVNQMDQVVQQNAAMVEQATAAAHSLKGETGTLMALVSRFTISGAPGRDAAAPANAPKSRVRAHAA
jgi:methyl-accepting chemotaxis protein